MRRKNSLRGLQLIGLLASTLLISPANAIVIGAGNVTPPGLGPGDTDVTGQFIIVEDGTLTVNGGSTLTVDAILGSFGQSSVSNIDIDGAGTTVNLVGIGGPLAAGIQGHTNLTISGGATVDATNSTSNNFAQNAGSSATVTITGAGTSVNFLNDQSLAVGVGLKGLSPTPDAPTNATMDILDGAVLNSGGASIAPARRTSDPSDPLSDNVTGTVTVSGTGSAWNMNNGNLTVGQGVNNLGILNIEAGGKVNMTASATFINAGRTDSTGNINIDGIGSELNLIGGPVGGGQASFMTIGRSGTGVLDITNGGKVTIDGLVDGTAPGFQIGRDEDTNADGTINVTGPGSMIEIKGDNRGIITVGRNNTTTGALNITAGGKVLQNTDAVNFIGRNAGATGTVLVSGTGSEYDGGRFIGVGVQSDEITNGGVGTLTVENNGLVKAETVRIGTDGTLTGAGGVVDANVVATAGGTVAPGSSPGDLGILGDIDLRNGGILEIEVGGIALGEFDRLFVGGTVLIDSTTAIVFSFIDGAASSPELLADEFIDINAFFFDINPVAFDIGDPTNGGQAFDPALFLPAQFFAVGDGFEIDVVVNSDGTFFQENNNGGGGTGVPEPGTLAVFGVGLAGLCAIRRRRKLAA